MATTIRLMTKSQADIDFGMKMKNHVKWNQIPADWVRFMDFDPEGCFIAEVDGLPVGTGTTTTYGDKVAWIGMIIVDENYRRHGIGRQIMLACMDYCKRKKIEVPKLDATPLGNKLYLTLGFVEEFLMDRREGKGGRFDCDRNVRKLGKKDLPEVIAYDAACFGVPRPGIIERFAGEYPEIAFVDRDAGDPSAALAVAESTGAAGSGSGSPTVPGRAAAEGSCAGISQPAPTLNTRRSTAWPGTS